MSENTCVLNNILAELKAVNKQLTILNDKVVSRTNAHFYVEFDTTTFVTGVGRKFTMRELFGIEKVNDLTIVALGGGFSISKNGETPMTTATLDLTYEDEDIYSINLRGDNVAGTAVIRLGAYVQRV